MNITQNTDASMTVAPQMFRDLLVEIVKSIAPFAHGMRRFSVTDRDVDCYIAEVTAAAASENPLPSKTVHRFVARGEETFNRAKTLYQWACEAYGRPPKIAVKTFPFACTEASVVQRAEEVRKHRQERLDRLGTRSWDDLCMQKLGAFASIAVSAVSIDLNDYDPYDFVHKSLCALSGDCSLFELAALAQHLEKETLKLVNLSVAGDTLVELPASYSAVRASKIVMVDSVPAPRGRVSEDWV